jgi:hypothetical protein
MQPNELTCSTRLLRQEFVDGQERGSGVEAQVVAQRPSIAARWQRAARSAAVVK